MLARVLYGGGLAMVAAQLLSPGRWSDHDRMAANDPAVYPPSRVAAVAMPQPYGTRDYPVTRFPNNPFPSTQQRLANNLPSHFSRENRFAIGNPNRERDSCDQHGPRDGRTQDLMELPRTFPNSLGQRGYGQRQVSPMDEMAADRALADRARADRALADRSLAPRGDRGFNEDNRPIPQPTLPPDLRGFGDVGSPFAPDRPSFAPQRPPFAPQRPSWSAQSPPIESRRFNPRPSGFYEPSVKAWGI